MAKVPSATCWELFPLIDKIKFWLVLVCCLTCKWREFTNNKLRLQTAVTIAFTSFLLIAWFLHVFWENVQFCCFDCITLPFLTAELVSPTDITVPQPVPDTLGELGVQLREFLHYLASLCMLYTKQNLGYYCLEPYSPYFKETMWHMHMNTYVVDECDIPHVVLNCSPMWACLWRRVWKCNKIHKNYVCLFLRISYVLPGTGIFRQVIRFIHTFVNTCFVYTLAWHLCIANVRELTV